MQKNDTTATIQELKALAKQLIEERDWQQFHSPQNLSMYLSIEANELMEKFLWVTKETSFDHVDTKREEIEGEAADVLITLLLFCNVSKIDITQAFIRKQAKIRERYPVEKSKGKSDKYDNL